MNIRAGEDSAGKGLNSDGRDKGEELFRLKDGRQWGVSLVL